MLSLHCVHDGAKCQRRRRPDLQGRILIALGQDYQRQGKNKMALQAYEQAAMRCAGLAVDEFIDRDDLFFLRAVGTEA